MMKHKIEKVGKCDSCGGTGVYQGLAEGGKLAVVCSRCKGTGKRVYVLEWEDFVGRQKRKNVTWVLQRGTSYKLGRELEGIGGMSYNDFLAGKPFPPKSEPRKWCCPAYWKQNETGEKNLWDCDTWGGRFCDCTHYKNKDECWARYDAENKK